MAIFNYNILLFININIQLYQELYDLIDKILYYPLMNHFDNIQMLKFYFQILIQTIYIKYIKYNKIYLYLI